MAKKALHERRGITFQEHMALLAVRAALAEGVLDMHPEPDPDGVEAVDDAHTFHMSCVMDKGHCGTVGCIGGYMAFIMGRGDEYVRDHVRWGEVPSYARDGMCSPSLSPLFFPPNGKDWPSATPKVAVKAIDNWLKDGNPRWSKLLPPVKDYSRDDWDDD